MPRFYLQHPFALGNVIDLPPTLAHHVLVLRLQIGSYILQHTSVNLDVRERKRVTQRDQFGCPLRGHDPCELRGRQRVALW